MTDQGELGDSMGFLALSLDSIGRPIPVVNTDAATDLFLRGDSNPQDRPRRGGAVRPPLPVGLFVGGLGPVVANDAYASREVWERFRRTPTTDRGSSGAAR